MMRGVVVALVVVTGAACQPPLVPCTSDNDCAQARICVEGKCEPGEGESELVGCDAKQLAVLQYGTDFIDLDTGDIAQDPSGSGSPNGPWDVTIAFSGGQVPPGIVVQNQAEGARVARVAKPLCDVTHADVAQVAFSPQIDNAPFVDTVLVDTGDSVWALGEAVDLSPTGQFAQRFSFARAP